MYSLDVQSIDPAEDAVDPEIKLTAALTLHDNREIFLDVQGSLWCNDIKLSALQCVFREERRRLDVSRKSRREYTTTVEMRARLTERAVDHIERYRDSQNSGDVDLELSVAVRRATVRLHIPNPLIFAYNAGQDERQALHGQFVKENMLGGNGVVNLLAATDNKEVLEIQQEERKRSIRIPSSDWKQRFCPALGVGEFLLFEFETPALNSRESDESAGLAERVEDATHTLQTMKRHMQEGNWTRATAKARDVAEVLRHQEEKIAELLRSDGIAPEAAEDLNQSLQGLFNYTSKLAHRLNRSGDELLSRQKPSKEDAYLAYTLSVAATKLIADKLSRHADMKQD